MIAHIRRVIDDPEISIEAGDTWPQVCTREYAPVCALLDKTQRQQYANACSACTDAVGYIAGPCPGHGINSVYPTTGLG